MITLPPAPEITSTHGNDNDARIAMTWMMNLLAEHHSANVDDIIEAMVKDESYHDVLTVTFKRRTTSMFDASMFKVVPLPEELTLLKISTLIWFEDTSVEALFGNPTLTPAMVTKFMERFLAASQQPPNIVSNGPGVRLDVMPLLRGLSVEDLIYTYTHLPGMFREIALQSEFFATSGLRNLMPNEHKRTGKVILPTYLTVKIMFALLVGEKLELPYVWAERLLEEAWERGIDEK